MKETITINLAEILGLLKTVNVVKYLIFVLVLTVFVRLILNFFKTLFLVTRTIHVPSR